MKHKQIIHYKEDKEVHEYIQSVTEPRSAGNNLSDWIRDATKTKMKKEKRKAK